MKIEMECPGCAGDGFNVPYGPNGYEPQEVCTACDGKGTVLIDKQCCFCKKDLSDADESKYERDNDGFIWCIPCFDRESDTGE